MERFFVKNFGCRASQADVAAIEAGLLAKGLASAAQGDAELVVLNTCTVTSTADDEVRQIMLQILMHPAPSIAGLVGSDVPPQALTCIDRMLAKKPEDRFRGADEALEAWKKIPS